MKTIKFNYGSSGEAEIPFDDEECRKSYEKEALKGENGIDYEDYELQTINAAIDRYIRNSQDTCSEHDASAYNLCIIG